MTFPRIVILLALVLFGAGASAAPTSHTLYLGTAPVVGVYFPAGGAICAMVNRHRAETGLRCVIERSDGSIANLEALRSGEEDMAIVQSDRQSCAVRGRPFKSAGPFEGCARLRIHGEPLTLIVGRTPASLRWPIPGQARQYWT
jgi:TRAP-type uncharacterized transport system substrate-binding protein